MKIALIIFDDLTLLDFAGVYDPLSRLKTMGLVPGLTCDVCAKKDLIRSFEGAVLVPGRVCPDLSEYDYVIVPGGDGIKDLMRDRKFLNWLPLSSEKTVIAAVCGGSLLLGAAGALRNRKATTHPALISVLKTFAKDVSGDRIVDEGRIITAGGVTAAIDLGLYLCERIAGTDAREKIAQQMDYSGYRAV